MCRAFLDDGDEGGPFDLISWSWGVHEGGYIVYLLLVDRIGMGLLVRQGLSQQARHLECDARLGLGLKRVNDGGF